MAQMPNTKPSPLLSSTLQTIANYFKPHRAEALQRIRVNGFCLIIVVVFSNLLPIPSLQMAIRTVLAANSHERWVSDWLYKWFCILEVAATTVFLFNLVEGFYAVKYPRPPLAPYASPAKTKPIFKGNPTPQRPFRVLSPNTSPQPQKPFSLSSTSKYPTSPMSSPSRVLQYSTLPASTNTQASSTSTMAFHSTPSPIISAYRGKHLNGSVGHAVDGTFLGRIAPEDLDEEN